MLVIIIIVDWMKTILHLICKLLNHDVIFGILMNVFNYK